MSINVIDFSIYEKLSCSAESAYKVQYASRQKYEVQVHFDKEFDFSLEVHFDSNFKKYSESHIQNQIRISVRNYYNNSAFKNIYTSLLKALESHYLVELVDGSKITLTAKNLGAGPSPQVPLLAIAQESQALISLAETQRGKDCQVIIAPQKKHIVHLPRTTFGTDYQCPRPGDRLYFVDSVGEHDVSIYREVQKVTESASCTCDVLELDRPIDRLQNSFDRIDGIGLTRPNATAVDYCAAFDKVKIFRKKENYEDLLKQRKIHRRQECCVELVDFFEMNKRISNLSEQLFPQCDNPHLADPNSQFYGSTFHWSEHEEQLQEIWKKFSPYLDDHLVVITSNKNRPDYLVHKDGGVDPYHASLTWPLRNCNSDSVSVWYEILNPDGSPVEYNDEKRTLTVNPGLQFNEIDRFVFLNEPFTPALLRHDIWHTVYNMSGQIQVRSLLQWRFKKTVSWNDAKNLVQEMMRSK